jgi:hypothetical protein
MKRRRQMVRPPKERSDAEATIASAISAIRLVHGAPQLMEKHRKPIITQMLWKVTEATWGKHFIQYRSHDVMSSPRKLWRHEHVHPRARLVSQILAGREDAIDKLVRDKNVACLVTKDEAKRLDRRDRKAPPLDGWERYRACNIHVVKVDAAGNISDFLVPRPA